MASERRNRFARMIAVPSSTGTIWEWHGARTTGVVMAEYRFQHKSESAIPGQKAPSFPWPSVSLWWETNRNVTAESVGTGNGTTKTFSHTTSNLSVVPGSVAVTIAGVGGFTLYDNRQGVLTGDSGGATCTINYATGVITLTALTVAPANSAAITVNYQYWKLIPSSYNTVVQVQNRVVGTGDTSTVTFTDTLSLPVVPKSINGVAGTVTFTDDGAGAITGTGVTAGTINYATGALSVTFTVAPGQDVLVSINYSHAASLKEGQVSRATFALGEPYLPRGPYKWGQSISDNGNMSLNTAVAGIPGAPGLPWVRLRGSGGPSMVEMILESDTCDLNNIMDGMQPSSDFENDIPANA